MNEEFLRHEVCFALFISTFCSVKIVVLQQNYKKKAAGENNCKHFSHFSQMLAATYTHSDVYLYSHDKNVQFHDSRDTSVFNFFTVLSSHPYFL